MNGECYGIIYIQYYFSDMKELELQTGECSGFTLLLHFYLSWDDVAYTFARLKIYSTKKIQFKLTVSEFGTLNKQILHL